MEEIKMRKLQIGVIGPEKGNYPKLDSPKKIKEFEEEIEKIGSLIAQNDATLITGGCDGIMEIASKGAKKYNGLTIGTPGRTRGSSNKFIDVEILTPIDVGDYLFAGILSCDSFIIIPGGAGTLAELALAYRYKKPMIIIKGYNEMYDKLIDNYLDSSKKVKFYGAENAEDAVELALKLAIKNLSESYIK